MFDPRKRFRNRNHKSKTKKPTRNWFTILLTLIFWSLAIFTIFFVDPALIKDIPIANSYAPFFLLLTATLATTSWLIFLNWKRTFIYTFIITLFLFLRLNGQGHFLNAILLASIIVAFEYYFGPGQKNKLSQQPAKKKS